MGRTAANTRAAFVLGAMCVAAVALREVYVLPIVLGLLGPAMLKGDSVTKIGGTAAMPAGASVAVAMWHHDRAILLFGLLMSLYVALIAALTVRGLPWLGRSTMRLDPTAHPSSPDLMNPSRGGSTPDLSGQRATKHRSSRPR